MKYLEVALSEDELKFCKADPIEIRRAELARGGLRLVAIRWGIAGLLIPHTVLLVFSDEP